MFRKWQIAGALFVIFFVGKAQAAELGLTSEQLQFLNDISIAVSDVEAPADIVVGKTIRLYATVHNNSDKDQKGVVRFYNEKLKQFIGTDQPFSAVANGSDTVFIDVTLGQAGENPLAIRVVPDQTLGNNPANDKVTTALVADHDADADGTSNRNDPDDDNDKTPDKEDAFPTNPAESKDTDKDGAGNNADTDDDNDGVSDVQDPNPINHGPVVVLAAGGTSNSRSNWWRQQSTETPSESIPEVSSGSNGMIQNQAGQEQTPSGTPPRPSQPKPIKAKIGETITFNAGESYDPDGRITTVEWNFDDGQTLQGSQVSHPFKSAGAYKVVAKVIDDQGESREETLAVQIGSEFPWPWAIAFFILILLIAAKGLLANRKSFKIRQRF